MARPILTPDLSRDIRDMERRIVELERASSRDFSGAGGSGSSSGLEVNILDYGGSAGGTFDNTSAIHAAKTALGPNGGTIVAPPGDYLYTNLNFSNTRSITFKGLGGLSAGAQPATRLISNSVISPHINLSSTFGFKLEDMAIRYTNGAFTGAVITLQQSSSLTDSAYFQINNCFIGGQGVRSAFQGIMLDKAIIGSINNCIITGTSTGVRGKAATTSYANAIQFRGCTFLNNTFQHVTNAGEAWVFDGCTFEHLCDASGNPTGAGAYTYGAGYFAKALAFKNCWFGDATAAGDWINFQGTGLTVESCQIGSGINGIRVGEDNQASGVVIKGNHFETLNTGVAIRPNGVLRADIKGNAYTGVTTEISGMTSARDMVYRDPADAKLKYIDTAGTVNLLY